MKMEMLIEELQEVVDNAFTFPLSGGKTVVNTDRLKEIIAEMKANVPQEIRQAKNIVADRSNIMSKAKQDAEELVQSAETRAKDIIQTAEAKAKELTNRHEITRNAQQTADGILSKANEEAEKIRKAANAYIENIMKKADDELSANLAQLQKTRQSLQALQNKSQQKRSSSKK